MTLQRYHEVSRLEAFSDAVFAFALTLLVVSLEVPRTYQDPGFMYVLMAPAHAVYGAWQGKRRRMFHESQGRERA
jgi:uncharacterized membrane protein